MKFIITRKTTRAKMIMMKTTTKIRVRRSRMKISRMVRIRVNIIITMIPMTSFMGRPIYRRTSMKSIEVSLILGM